MFFIFFVVTMRISFRSRFRVPVAPSETGGLSCRRGFTLIEMALMLVVAGTLMLGAVAAIRSQSKKTLLEKNHQAMREIEGALLGFMAVKGHLPCPDWFDPVTNKADGDEDRDLSVNDNGPCINSLDGQQLGLLPWRTLGISPMDKWGNFYTYRVSSAYTVAGAHTLSSNGDMTFYSENGVALVNGIPVMVVSHGPNGFGAYRMSLDAKVKVPFVNATLREKENIIDDGGDNTDNPNPERFYQGGDDILMWIPLDVIKLQAVESNWLP
ncbi:MAG: type II secretion system protein [Magnetococcales bacterium]|nr:type II secretion system protein [Magnetococcales bacterium]